MHIRGYWLLLGLVWMQASGALWAQAEPVFHFVPSKEKVETLTVLPNTEDETMLFIWENENMGIKVQEATVDGTFGKQEWLFWNKENEIEKSLNEIGPELDQLIAAMKCGDGCYQFIWADDMKRKFFLVKAKLGVPRIRQSIELVKTLPRREHFAGIIRTGGAVILMTLEKSSSIIHLHRFSPSGGFQEIVHDLSEEEFEVSRFGTLYGGIFANSKVIYSRASPKVLHFDPENPFHPSKAALSFPAKVYAEPSRLVLTLDLVPTHTLAIELPLDGRAAKVHRLPSLFPLCESKRFPQRPNSAYAKGKLWQLKGCEKGLNLKVYDLDTQKVIKEDALLAEALDTVALVRGVDPATSASFLQGLLVGMRAKPSSKKENLFAHLEESHPRISVVAAGQDSVSVQVSIVDASEEMFFMAAVLQQQLSSMFFSLEMLVGAIVLDGEIAEVSSRIQYNEFLTCQTTVDPDKMVGSGRPQIWRKSDYLNILIEDMRARDIRAKKSKRLYWPLGGNFWLLSRGWGPEYLGFFLQSFPMQAN